MDEFKISDHLSQSDRSFYKEITFTEKKKQISHNS